MHFENATYADETNTSIRATVKGIDYLIPVSERNRHYQMILEEGITVADFVPEAPPTEDERVDDAFAYSDMGKVLMLAIMDLKNEIRELQKPPLPPITRSEMRTWLKTKLEAVS